MADWRDRITADPEILVGKPIIKGTRISVELVLGWLANGWSFEQISCGRSGMLVSASERGIEVLHGSLG
jgi:hypothetical protein